MPNWTTLRADRQPLGPQGLHLPVQERGVESTHVPLSGSDAKLLQEVKPPQLCEQLQLKSDLRSSSSSLPSSSSASMSASSSTLPSSTSSSLSFSASTKMHFDTKKCFFRIFKKKIEPKQKRNKKIVFLIFFPIEDFRCCVFFGCHAHDMLLTRLPDERSQGDHLTNKTLYSS